MKELVESSPKLYAFAYDHLEGTEDIKLLYDGVVSNSLIEYCGESFKDLVGKYGEKFPDEDKEAIVGFWIIEESLKKVFDKSICESFSRESEVFAQGVTLRGIVKGNAVKIVVSDSK